MGLIHLHNLEFFAHNGFYEEERKIGNRYAVDIEIDTDFDEASENDDLSKTVNYELVYKIVYNEIHKDSKLLERIVAEINKSIYHKFNHINSVKTTVCKFNPPFDGLCEKVCISEKLTK